jgi:uncharacterized protein YegP (UPF0339 family)
MSKFVVRKVIREAMTALIVYEWLLLNNKGETVIKSIGYFKTIDEAKKNIAEVKKCANRFAKVEVICE